VLYNNRKYSTICHLSGYVGAGSKKFYCTPRENEYSSLSNQTESMISPEDKNKYNSGSIMFLFEYEMIGTVQKHSNPCVTSQCQSFRIHKYIHFKNLLHWSSWR